MLCNRDDLRIGDKVEFEVNYGTTKELNGFIIEIYPRFIRVQLETENKTIETINCSADGQLWQESPGMHRRIQVKRITRPITKEDGETIYIEVCSDFSEKSFINLSTDKELNKLDERETMGN